MGINKKLVLDEGIEPIITEPMIIDTKETEDSGVSSVLTQLLKQKWEAVDTINSDIATLKELQTIQPEIIKTLEEIAQDEMIHIGQLEKILPLVDIKAEVINNQPQEEIMTPEVPGDFIVSPEELILR